MDDEQNSQSSCTHQIHQYIPNSPTPEAHTLETWTPISRLTRDATPKYWIIYIHGGAWWRPMITSSSFTITVQHLLTSPLSPHISGFASLNYRLSTPPPLPQFSQYQEPDDPARNIKHPDHLNDVVNALHYLQETFGVGENYILVGHSCGATLAFQIPSNSVIETPAAVLGVEGIYDLKKLRDDHADVPMYQYFTESAFGTNEEAWKEASPTTQKNHTGGFAWEKAKVVALAQSNEDELVNSAQRDVMWEGMERAKVKGRKHILIELKGKHDEIWRDAEPVPQLMVAIEKVLRELIAG